MPFDANLVLASDAADWTYANLGSYGSPSSTTRNDGGFAVIDLGASNLWSDRRGLAIVLVFLDAANDAADALTCTAEESEEVAFGESSYYNHTLCEFDIAAVTNGVILGSEVTAGTIVVRRVFPRYRYIRLKAAATSGDDFGTVWGLISPYPMNRL